METVREYLKGIKLSLSDFLLMFGFLFSIPFYAFAWKFMVTSDPSQVFFNNRMIITCFAMTVICWAIYFILEIKKGRIKFRLFTWIYVVIAIVSVVAVLIQKTTNVFYVKCNVVGPFTQQYYPDANMGDIIKVVSILSPTHKLFFAYATFVITTIFYIVLVVLPKRIKKMEFLVIIGIITMVFMACMCVYSYIAEANKYVLFLKAALVGDGAEMKHNAMNGFVVASVPYGVCMLLAFVFALLTHMITKKNYWYIAMAFFLINMLFSYCRTSIVISFVLILTYVTFRLIATIKAHKVKNSILITLIYLCIFGAFGIVLTSFLTKGSFLPPVYNHLKWFFNKSTYKTRKVIWGNVRKELTGGWLVIGRGFGTHNCMLYLMNLVDNDNAAPSHSTYYAILGAGGLIALIAFFGLMVYYAIVFVKTLKYNKSMPFLLSLPLLGFLAYSFTEGVNHLIVTFTFPLILYYHIVSKKTVN